MRKTQKKMCVLSTTTGRSRAGFTTQFTRFTGTNVQILTRRKALLGAQFTCFTGRKVQILTLRAASQSAAGAIAALSIQHGIQPRALDPALVQHVLIEAGCTLAIKPSKARWGTPEWKAYQLAELSK